MPKKAPTFGAGSEINKAAGPYGNAYGKQPV